MSSQSFYQRPPAQGVTYFYGHYSHTAGECQPVRDTACHSCIGVELAARLNVRLFVKGTAATLRVVRPGIQTDGGTV